MGSNQDGVSGESDSSNGPSEGGSATAVEAVSDLSDADLLAETRRLVCLSNRVLAALLAHLAEVEARGLHRARACASLFTYCIYELRVSEDAAFRRVAAARLVKRFPQLLGAVERGELQLTALLLLAPHLTEANVGDVMARARFRTKKEVVKLVRLLSPLPDVPSRIEPLGLERPRLRPTWGNLLAARHPVRDLPPDQRPANWLPASNDVTHDVANELTALPFAAADAGPPCDGALDLADAPNDLVNAPNRLVDPPTDSGPPEPPSSAPLDPTATTLSGPQRYSVQFTASEEYVALVEEAKALLAHTLPSATLAEIHLRALRSLVAELRKRKFTQSNPSTRRSKAVATAPQRDDLTGSPRQRDDLTDSPRQRGRAVPAAIRRSVFERDGHRCAYVDGRGVRCRETERLELHHHEPFARGGPSTTENLSLYCSAHNTLAAEQDFGRERIIAKREERSYFTERTLARSAGPDG